MPALPNTVDVDCPRPGCDTRITVPLEIESVPPKPGAKSITVNVRVQREELANRMAEHYGTAHSQKAPAASLGESLRSRAIGYAGQAEGTLVAGLLETFNIGDGKAEEGPLTDV